MNKEDNIVLFNKAYDELYEKICTLADQSRIDDLVADELLDGLDALMLIYMLIGNKL